MYKRPYGRANPNYRKKNSFLKKTTYPSISICPGKRNIRKLDAEFIHEKTRLESMIVAQQKASKICFKLCPESNFKI